MTSFVPYVPSPTAPFAFTATLDGQAYVATVVWGLFGRRLFLDLRDTAGRLILLRPVIGSPTGFAIQSISWTLGIITIETAEPHGFAITDTIALAFSGCLPVTLNGTRRALIVSATAMTFPLAENPGIISALGKVDYNIDIAAGYFANSSLVFRQATGTFEVLP